MKYQTVLLTDDIKLWLSNLCSTVNNTTTIPINQGDHQAFHFHEFAISSISYESIFPTIPRKR